jgi:hypothetical protein
VGDIYLAETTNDIELLENPTETAVKPCSNRHLMEHNFATSIEQNLQEVTDARFHILHHNYCATSGWDLGSWLHKTFYKISRTNKSYF